MAADTDFNALYAELGVDADCDIAQFRLAYRRRVGSLHPDRIGGDDGLARLQRRSSTACTGACPAPGAKPPPHLRCQRINRPTPRRAWPGRPTARVIRWWWQW